MKTLEFKAYLTPRQTEKVESWLKAMRWVWNKGLALLNEYSHHYFFDKRFKEAYRCCYVGWEYHWTKDGDEWKPERPYCSLNYGQRCLLPDAEPELGNDSYYSLTTCFTHEKHKDKPWFTDVPSKFIKGTLKSLADSWMAWKKRIRKRPRRKKTQDPITTLIFVGAKSRIEGRRVSAPKLGTVKAYLS